MGKLRNGGTDIEKVAQWFGRKCRNHNPLEELGMVGQKPDRYAAKAKGELFMCGDTQKDTLIYQSNGRTVQIKFEELTGAEVETLKETKELVAVGY